MLKLVPILLTIGICLIATINSSPLDDYVNAPDDHFKYELIYTYDRVGFKVYVLNMTSQKWKDESFVKNPIWWHYVAISVPDKILRPDAGFMFIQGGGQGNP
jgi:PhoPQ-activated pathogenicity-related protein